MRRVVVILTLIFVFISVVPAFGQTPSWEIYLLETSTGRVLRVSPDGLSATSGFPEMSNFSVISDAILAPDGVTLVFSGFRAGETGVYIASLQDGTCCTKLPDIIPSGADFVALGNLNPDGTKVAAVLSKINVNDPSESRAGFVVTYDLANQVLADFTPISSFSDGTTPLIGAYLGTWTEQGIEVFATCMTCDRPTEGAFSIWKPETEEFTPNTTVYLGGGHLLEATGEIVWTARDEIYPTGPGLLGNVVRYLPTTATGHVPFVIYYHTQYTLISSVNWIHSGDSLLIAHAGTDVVTNLGRDGSETEYTIPPQNQFLATTPDGWLAGNETDLIHYTIQGGQLSENVLGSVYDTLMQVGGTQMSPQGVTEFPQQLP